PHDEDGDGDGTAHGTARQGAPGARPVAEARRGAQDDEHEEGCRDRDDVTHGSILPAREAPAKPPHRPRPDTMHLMAEQTRADRSRFAPAGGSAGGGLRRAPRTPPPPDPVEICEPEVGEVPAPPYEAATIDRTAEVFKALAA